MLRPSRNKSRKEPDTGLTAAELSEVRTKSPHLDDKALRSALQNFQSLDRDNDGRLSQEEFRQGLGMLGMDPTFSSLLFNSFDTGGDGYIDRREFVAAMAVMMHPDNVEEQIDLAFDAYDVNKDGMLDYEELRAVIAAVFSTMEQMGIASEMHDPEAVANELFHIMDRGAKGHVTKDDYLHLARTHPEHLKQVGLGGANSHRGRRSRRASSLANYPAPKQKRRAGGNPRKRGTTVTFGHEKWELVVQMMLGIRLAVGSAAEAASATAGAAGLTRQSSSASERETTPTVTPQPSGQSSSERGDGGPSERGGEPSVAVAAASGAPAAAAPPPPPPPATAATRKNGRTSNAEVHVTLQEPGAAAGHEAVAGGAGASVSANAPGSSAMHGAAGKGAGAAELLLAAALSPAELESRRLRALRGTSSRGRFDRSEPFTVLLHKRSQAERLGVLLSSPGDDGLVLVHELTAGGLAASSGKLRVGDVLVAVNEAEVHTTARCTLHTTARCAPPHRTLAHRTLGKYAGPPWPTAPRSTAPCSTVPLLIVSPHLLPCPLLCAGERARGGVGVVARGGGRADAQDLRADRRLPAVRRGRQVPHPVAPPRPRPAHLLQGLRAASLQADPAALWRLGAPAWSEWPSWRRGGQRCV